MAQVLVEVLLEQKVHNSNELVAAQETLVASMRQCPLHAASDKQELHETGDAPKLSASASFLQDMAQQVRYQLRAATISGHLTDDLLHWVVNGCLAYHALASTAQRNRKARCRCDRRPWQHAAAGAAV